MKAILLTARFGADVAPTRSTLVGVEFVINAARPPILGELNVAKLPVELAKFRTSKGSSSPGAKPLMRATLSVPSSAAVPVTLTWSNNAAGRRAADLDRQNARRASESSCR